MSEPILPTSEPLEFNGLTKREEFARSAMLGILASESEGNFYDPEWAAERSVLFADALIARLAKGGEA
jgi:hypothetical protein